MSTIQLSKAPHIYYHAHLPVGIFISAKEAQLATYELGHLHWAGHWPLNPSTTDGRSKTSTLKYNMILYYIVNALCLDRFAVTTAVTEVLVFLVCCLGTVGKYTFPLICLLFYQLPILFDCGHDKYISHHSTNSFIVIRTVDKRSEMLLKYLCGSKNYHIDKKMSLSFSLKMSRFLETLQYTPSCSLQNSQRHSSRFMNLTFGQLRNCVLADHMMRSAGMYYLYSPSCKCGTAGHTKDGNQRS